MKPTKSKLDRALNAIETIALHAGAVAAMVKAGQGHYTKARKRRVKR